MRSQRWVATFAAVLQLEAACSGTHDCEPLVGPAEPCGGSTCSSGHYCVSDAGPPACAVAKPIGAACVRGVECVSVICQQGADGGQCAPQLCL